jgi:Uma2 family endonuclease
MANSVLFEEQIEIPFVRSLADFRAWALSEDFPERGRGRIDYITGRIEVDMSPEDFFSHGTLKTEIIRGLMNIVKTAGLGELVTDSTRISSPVADLSVEPDVVFISEESLESGRVRLIPKASHEPDRYVEVEGAPDLIVEIVSDSSATKDTKRLPASYWRAGVREFWLADARGETVAFQIYQAGPSDYQPAETDADGFQYSPVLSRWFRLTRARNPRGRWAYDLQAK